MKVLVVGATGRTGRELLHAAVAAGHEVTALARHPADLDDVPGIVTVAGDVLRADSLIAAVTHQEAVLSALGPRPGGSDDLRAAGTRNLVSTMAQQGVHRLIALSAFGVGDSRRSAGLLFRLVLAPLFLRASLADQGAMEAVVRASGLEWTLVRTTRLTDGPGLGTWKVLSNRGPGLSGKISRCDTAAFMVAQLRSTAFVGAAPGLTA